MFIALQLRACEYNSFQTFDLIDCYMLCVIICLCT